MSCGVDVLVVGGGPAGCAAAIWAAQYGLRTTLLERVSFPRYRPGETLHPGVGAIFRQLGVEREVCAASTTRFHAIAVNWAGRATHELWGGSESAAGYQILRSDLDAILMARACAVGVRVVQPAPALEPVMRARRVCGVAARDSNWNARFVVDSTGMAAWLSRHLGLTTVTASPHLSVHYGYCTCDHDELRTIPHMVGDREGWTWVARVRPGLVHWSRLAFRPATLPACPPALERAPATAPIRGAVVTWRSVSESAGPGYFLTGDAATVVDPACSHGVLRALMSGMMSAYLMQRIVAGSIDEDAAARQYRRWMGHWFDHDVKRLRVLYGQLGWTPAATNSDTR